MYASNATRVHNCLIKLHADALINQIGPNIPAARWKHAMPVHQTHYSKNVYSGSAIGQIQCQKVKF